MANTIKQKRGTTDPGASDLVVGELAINTTDGGVFTKTDGGTVVEVGAGGASEINDLSDGVTNSSGQTVGLGAYALNSDDGTSNYNTAVGYTALYNTTSGAENNGFGNQALYANTTGSRNNAFGYRALQNSTTAVYNTAAGHLCLRNITTGSENTALGYQAGQGNQTGGRNTYLGNEAGKNVGTSQSDTVAVGYRAGQYTGNESVWLGANAGTGASGAATSSSVGVGRNVLVVATSYGNTAVGFEAAKSVTSGQNNTILGRNAANYSTPLTTGSNNIVIGFNAEVSSASVSNEITLGDSNITSLRIPGLQSGASNGQVLTYNSSNGDIEFADASGGATDIDGLSDARTNTTSYVHLGTGAGGSSTAGTALGISAGFSGLGTASTYLGRQAGYYITGQSNTFVGEDCGLGDSSAATGPDSNTGMGRQALYSLTSGDDNVGIGFQALRSVTSGRQNNAMGYRAGYSMTTGQDNVYIGNQAGYSSTTATYCAALGFQAGYSSTTGTENTYLGWSAGYSTSNKSYNTYIGSGAGYFQTGDRNVSLGRYALKGSSGSSGVDNVAIGYEAGEILTSGSNCTFVGKAAGNSVTTGLNNIVIGANADASSTTVSNEITLGNSSITSLRIPGLQAGASDGQVLTYNSTNGDIEFADAGGASAINDLSDARTGSQYVHLGNNTGGTSTRGTAVGISAGFNGLTSGSSYLGYQAGYNVTGTDNTFIGQNCGYGDASAGAGPVSNTGVGYEAIQSISTGDRNVALGYQALQSATSGKYNTVAGYRAGENLTTSLNVTCIGYTAGSTITTGSNTTCIGYAAEPSSATVSNEITLGNSSVTSLRIPGLQSGASDGQVLTYNSTDGDLELADAPGATYELIEDGTSKAAGSYIDISGYKAVYMICHDDTATNSANRNGPYLSTSNSSNSGVSTRSGRRFRRNYAGTVYSSASHNPSTSAIYYGSNVTSDNEKMWKLTLQGLDTSNVFIEAYSENVGSYQEGGWSGVTTAGSSTWYLYIHQALLQYQIYGVK